MGLEVLYLIRHGKAAATHPDGDRYRTLSEEGRRRVEQMARQAVTRDFHFDLALSSPFVRAVQTRALLAPSSGAEQFESPSYVPSSFPDEAIDNLTFLV